MTRVDFFLLLAENLGTYLIVLAIVTALMSPIIKKNCKGLFDPLFYAILIAIFANSIPIFLYINGQIKTSYLIYFFIAECFLWISFCIGFNLKIKYQLYFIKSDFQKSTVIFYILGIFLLVFFFIQLKFFGFGALSNDRFSVFKNSGGWGIILKLNSFICTFILFYTFYVWNRNNTRKCLKIVSGIAFIVSCLYIFLQGSKSALLQVLFIFYFYYIVSRKYGVPRKARNALICLAGASVIFMFSIKYDVDDLSSICLSVAERSVVNGDIYWYALPHEQIENIKPAKWSDDLFRPFIYSLRLKDRKWAIPAVGTQLVYQVYPNRNGLMVGANSRPPIWSYAMFGKFGWIFTLIWGFLLGHICRIAMFNSPKGIIGTVCGYTFFSAALAGLSDPQLMFMFMFDGLIGVIMLFVILILVEIYFRSNHIS